MAQAGKTTTLKEPKQDGYHYPRGYRWDAFPRYYLSDGVALPEEGGMSAQDPDLMEDLNRMWSRVSYHVRLLTKK